MTEVAHSDPYEICKRVQFGSRPSSLGRPGTTSDVRYTTQACRMNTFVTGGSLSFPWCDASSFSIDSFSQSIVGMYAWIESFQVKMWCRLKRSSLYRIRSEYTDGLSFHSAIQKSRSVDKQKYMEERKKKTTTQNKMVKLTPWVALGWSRNSLCLNLDWQEKERWDGG